MNPAIERLKRIFLIIFALACAVVLVWQVGWVIPRDKCESGGKWWDPYGRVCAQPVLVSDITGRVIHDDKALAEARAAIGRPAPAPGKH
jgi:hypothetical protein